MINLSRDKALQVWGTFWDDMTDEFFKVEDLQEYADEQSEQQSSLSLWLRGDKEAALEAIRAHQAEWSEQTRTKRAHKIRVHVIDEPLSEYLQWEIEHYKLVNIPLGGEEVYLVNRRDVPEYDLGDFMMFDTKKVAKSHYSSGGYLESMDLYDGESVQAFIDAKQLLLQFAQKVG